MGCYLCGVSYVAQSMLCNLCIAICWIAIDWIAIHWVAIVWIAIDWIASDWVGTIRLERFDFNDGALPQGGGDGRRQGGDGAATAAT